MAPPPAEIVQNGFLSKLRRGEIANTCLVKLMRTVEAPMLLRTAGFDSILIDMEHSTLSLDCTSQICLAALYAGITPIVRSPTKEPFFVSRILDGGALGVIVPHIRCAQDARDVVNAAKFQPIGHRSATASLPHLQFRPLPAKVASPAINAATMVIPMIETLEAVEDVDEIAAVPGVDSLLIGTNDLTAEMDIPGEYEHPRVHEAYLRTIAACKKHNVFLGIGGLHSRPDLLEKYCMLGANWILAGSDASLLLSAATRVAADVVALGSRVQDLDKSHVESPSADTKVSKANGVANGIKMNGVQNPSSNSIWLSREK